MSVLGYRKAANVHFIALSSYVKRYHHCCVRFVATRTLGAGWIEISEFLCAPHWGNELRPGYATGPASPRFSFRWSADLSISEFISPPIRIAPFVT